MYSPFRLRFRVVRTVITRAPKDIGCPGSSCGRSLLQCTGVLRPLFLYTAQIRLIRYSYYFRDNITYYRAPHVVYIVYHTLWNGNLLFRFLIICFVCVTDACSSRSTPKPRPLQPTERPNITFHTTPCPTVYARWYCLNDATCFAIEIGESVLYNCEWVILLLLLL